VDFKVDSVSLVELERNPTWKDEAKERIRQHRMSDLIIKVVVGEDKNPDDVEIQVSD
jgi:hypothetical protein